MNRKIQEPEDIDFNIHKENIDCLKTEFERRFSKLNEDRIYIKLFSNPFNFSDEEFDLIDLNLQMEAVDFKTNSF